MRKLRKTGAVDQDGNLVTIPRLPSVAGANKPPGWNRWSAAEKIEHLLRLSLDRMNDYLSWPADDLDPYRLAAQTQVIRVVAMVAAKVGDQARAQTRAHYRKANTAAAAGVAGVSVSGETVAGTGENRVRGWGCENSNRGGASRSV
jgi:hypothetical protein